MSKKFEPYEYLNDNGFFNNDFQYYKKRNVYVDRESYSSKINHLSIYDFLMSKQSLISFCNFIKKTKAEEEAAIHKQEVQDKEENSLIGDILESVQKDMMDSI